MSIASEITALGNNLTAAKNAVTTKGGTVGDTGLAGLASEIASIPSGGTLSTYGTITYLDNSNVEQTVELETEEDLFEICTSTPGNTMVNIGNVSFEKDKIRSVTIADGVTFVPDDFLRYAYANASWYSPITVNLPDTITYIGNNFCAQASLANQLNLLNVKYIGDYFLYSLRIAYPHPINLPKIEYIGTYFVSANASTFNSVITLNTNCRIIGAGFLSGCWHYSQPFTIPSGLEPEVDGNPGIEFMYQCRDFTGPLVCNSRYITDNSSTLSTTSSGAAMCTTGVTLTGTYAQNWKDALPDRTSSPYRKLIVGS